jgi:periplasmic protein TonB
MEPASHPAVSPFGVLIDDVEREAVRRHPARPHAADESSPERRAPELRFETLADRDAASVAGGRRRWTLPISIAVHAVAVAAIVVIPLFVSQSLPEASGGVRAFLVEPAMAAAPPPPPPPAPRSTAARSVTPPPTQVASGLVAPVEVPSDVKPETADVGLGGFDGGVPGGVEGGVPGGVIGGIVGGLQDAPPPAPAVKPVRGGGFVKEPKRVRYVAPEYPQLAVQARLQGVVIIEATIDATGKVADAKVLRGMPMLDDAAISAVRQWTYTPTFLDGHPTPVLMVVTVNFRLGESARS